MLNSFDLDAFVALLTGGNAGALYVQYTWDAENRLIGVEPGGTPGAGEQKLAFAYDYLGRRVEKKVWTYNSGWSLTEHRKFLYDGWLMLLELDGSDNIIRRYTWGLDLAGQADPSRDREGAGGIGGLLALQDWNGTSGEGDDLRYVYFYDANGNVGQVSDLSAPSASASIKAHYEYDPYGNLTAQSGDYAETNPFRWSTKYWDDQTGLGYWGYRYYDPRLGRWLNRDPIGELGAVNLYGYVINDPLNRVDSLGNLAVFGCPSQGDPQSTQPTQPATKPATQPTPCQQALQKALDDPRVKAMKDTLGECWLEPRCGGPGDCPPQGSGGRTVGRRVIMCGDFSVEELLHELIHVWQNCKVKDGKPVVTEPKDTDYACRETQAASCSGECDDYVKYFPPYTTTEECVLGTCKDNTIRNCLDKQKEDKKACGGKQGKDLENWAEDQCRRAYESDRCKDCTGLPF